MTKAELVAAVAAKAELSKKDTEKAIAAVISTISETLAKGESIQLVGCLLYTSDAADER